MTTPAFDGTVRDPLRGVATPPRRILPGTVWFITRRCSERRCFLRPCRATNDSILYALAYAAGCHGVMVHAICVMSNHVHLVVTDVKGRLPWFMRELNSLIARSVNASLGRSESLWAKDRSYSAVEPQDRAAVRSKIAYTLANPVAAGLVARGSEWPGLWTSPEQIGSTKLVVRRPKRFYDCHGLLPESVELELTVPSEFGSADEFRSELVAELRALEEKHRRELASQGRSFLGAARVRAQDPFAGPPSGAPGFGLNPRIAGRCRATRIEGILGLKSWLQEYQKARIDWCAGIRDVLFPAGTWLMCVLHGATCAGAG